MLAFINIMILPVRKPFLPQEKNKYFLSLFSAFTNRSWGFVLSCEGKGIRTFSGLKDNTSMLIAEPLITIPPREVLQCYRPDSFKKLLPNVTVIVDCTEFEMERPSALDSQSACYSSYKSRTTMKSLLGITPSGVCKWLISWFNLR